MNTRTIGRAVTGLGVAALMATGMNVGTAQARTTGTGSFEKVVNEVDERQDWCNGMGCAEHQHTNAKLVIVYTSDEDEDGNVTAKPTSAHLKGRTRTWTDLVLAGFHATSQVTAGPVYFQTPQFRYGVDGTWIGTSDRTDEWVVAVPLSSALADRSAKGGVLDINFTRG